MAVVGDNRGGRHRSVEQRPDGSWPLDDARQRREQRTAEKPRPAPPPIHEPGEDLCGYALSLADSALTSDGKPFSDEVLAERQNQGSGALAVPSSSDPERQPVADELLLAMQTDGHRATASDQRAPRSAQRSIEQARGHRIPRPRLRLLIACAGTAVLVGALVAAIDAGTHSPPGSVATQRLAGMTTNPAASLNTAAADVTLAVVHAADRKLTMPRNTRAKAHRRPPHANHTRSRASTRHAGSTHAVNATAASTAASQPAATTPEQTPTASASPTSTSNPSSYNAPPANSTAQDTQPASSSQTPSQPAGPSGPGGTIGTNCNPKCK